MYWWNKIKENADENFSACSYFSNSDVILRLKRKLVGLEQNKTKTRKETEDRSGLHVVKTTVNFRLFFFFFGKMASILSFVQGTTAADSKSKREKGQKGLQGSFTKDYLPCGRFVVLHVYWLLWKRFHKSRYHKKQLGASLSLLSFPGLRDATIFIFCFTFSAGKASWPSSHRDTGRSCYLGSVIPVCLAINLTSYYWEQDGWSKYLDQNVH